MSIKILIADDHAMVREGLRGFLSLSGDLETVDVAADRGAGPFRLPVQWVIRPEESARRERRYAGTVAGGLLFGDGVVPFANAAA